MANFEGIKRHCNQIELIFKKYFVKNKKRSTFAPILLKRKEIQQILKKKHI